ncbi:MAG: hypothetical protein H6737_16220 [Alphaproteobacteria bacterium]|nr:hypothetical protein [Alphaproteobacteria bacterium]
MGILDELSKAIAGIVESIEQHVERQHASFWAERHERLVSAGLSEFSRRRGRLLARARGASVEIVCVKTDKADYTTFTWRFDTPLDGRVSLATPGVFEKLSDLLAGRSGGRVSVGRGRSNAFLATPEVLDLAERVATGETTFTVKGTGVDAQRHGRDLAGLDDQVALVEALVRRWSRRHQALELLGLAPVADGGWEGVVDGVAIRVSEHVKHGLTTTHIEADLARSLPAGTLVRKRGRDEDVPKDARIGDIVLDQVLVARTSDAEALRLRIAREPLRSELLGLLGSWRESELSSTALVVRMPGAIVDACEVGAVARAMRAFASEG